MERNRYRGLFDLQGKVAMITGGAGILGRHFAAALADFGAAVALVDSAGEAATELAAEVAATFSVKAIGIQGDVGDADAFPEAVEQIERALGPIDILHNNAATKGHDLERFFDSVEDFRAEVWREVMAVNLDGMFFAAREVGGRMARRGGGSIVQTASIYGLVAPDQRIYEGSEYQGRPINTPAVYSASKAGVVGLTRHLAAYWAEQGVRVNSLTPGGVGSGQNDTFQQRYAARVPLGRMAEADELTGALVFLASDASSYVTGQNIVVDGGLSAW